MSVQLTADQNNLIKNIALKEGFSDFELETKSGSMKGDGYLGIITTVKVKNGNKKLDLIMKTALTNEELRRKAPVRAAYLREIYIYETVFQEFEKFQRENGVIDRFSGIAKFYGSCDKENNECLVLENLREIGYKLWNRMVPMNSEHVALVFAEYGKLHAISWAMNSKKPEMFKKLTTNFENIFKSDDWESFSKTKQYILANGFKAVKGNNLATEALTRFGEQLDDFCKTDLETVEDKLVILHGDCWCNNLMFKYEDSQEGLKPTKVRLLDWQISQIGSPVMDLSYFLFVCSPKEVLIDFERYLKIYHHSVSESLQKFSCDVETIFPFTLLEYHWKKYAKYALFMALMLLKIILSEEGETLDLAEAADSKNSMLDIICHEISHDDIFNQRILDIVTVMAENKLI